MTAEPALRRSPLAHFTERFADATRASRGNLRLAEVPFLTQVNLRLDIKGPAAAVVEQAFGTALPPEPNTATITQESSVLCLGPDEWLVVAAPGADVEPRLRAALAGHPASVTDVSAHRTTLLVAGPRASEVLSQGCSLDLHPRSFTAGRCAQTNLARAQIILVPRDAVKPGHWIMVRSSFASYLAEWLLDAATEHLSAAA